MRRSLALLIIMLVVILSAYVTKPDDEKCIAEAKRQYKESVIGKVKQTLPASINEKLFTETLEKVFEQSLSIEDRILYKDILQ